MYYRSRVYSFVAQFKYDGDGMYFIEINVEIDYFSCEFPIDIFGFTYISMKIHILAIFVVVNLEQNHNGPSVTTGFITYIWENIK